MPTFVSLVNWTEQGVKNIKEAPGRGEAAKALAKKMGGEIKHIFYTAGEYDLVVVAEFHNGDDMTKFALAVGAQGNVRTKTTRAWSEDEFKKVVSTMP